MTINFYKTSDHSLLTRRETAELLGIKAQTLAKWASTQRYDLPYVKVGKAVRYRKTDIEQYVARNTVGVIDDHVTLQSIAL